MDLIQCCFMKMENFAIELMAFEIHVVNNRSTNLEHRNFTVDSTGTKVETMLLMNSSRERNWRFVEAQGWRRTEHG
jgi:hypothetical protein